MAFLAIGLALVWGGPRPAGQGVRADAPGAALDVHFFKGVDGRTYVPMSLSLGRPVAGEVVLYVRAQRPGAGPAVRPTESFTAATPSGGRQLTTALLLTPGEYDFIAAVLPRKQRGGVSDAERAAARKSAALAGPASARRRLLVPDYTADAFIVSSLVLATRADRLQAPVVPGQVEGKPYTFGTTELEPVASTRFRQQDRVVAFIEAYHPRSDDRGLPSVLGEFAFYRRDQRGEKFFNKMKPQAFDRKTLPQGFDPAKEDIAGGYSIPLESFVPGEYRLVVTMTDRISRQKVSSEASFVVE